MNTNEAIMESTRRHWDAVYSTKPADRVSWYQAEPEPSLTMIAATAVGLGDGIVDIGSGASLLVDRLLASRGHIGHAPAVQRPGIDFYLGL